MTKNICCLHFIVFAHILNFSCFNSTAAEGNAAHEVKFYYRMVGENNGVKSYGDKLIITNYQNKSMSIKEFYEIAKNYIDTVKSDLPVTGVSFIGQKQGESLPPPDPDFTNEQRKYFLIAFSFHNVREKSKAVELSLLFIWKNDKAQDFYPYVSKKYVDSLITSDTPFDNGFK